jgi:hypothetical protein
MGYKKLLLSAALAAVTVATAFAFDLSRPPSSAIPSEEKLTAPVETPLPPPPSPSTTQSETPLPVDEYVHREGLWPKLRSAFGVMGDRLEKPGKERLVMTGTFTRAGETAPTSFTMVREFPDRLRLEMQNRGQRRVSVYNRRAAEHSNRPRREAEEIEMLVFDTAERFFTAHAEGAAMRHLGDRFRLDEDSSDNQSYNLYEVTDDVDTGARSRQQTKIYALDSDTLLLARVSYEIERDGQTVRVEVRLDNWQRVQGQMVPWRVERRENDVVVFSLDLTSVAVGSRQDDGTFTAAPSSN